MIELCEYHKFATIQYLRELIMSDSVRGSSNLNLQLYLFIFEDR